MSKHKNASADNTSLWLLAVLLSSVGGMGKSLSAEMMALYLKSTSANVQVFSADVQNRLAEKLGSDCVQTIDVDLLDAANDDPLALIKAFAPFTKAVTMAPATGSSIVLDTKAGDDIMILRLMHALQLDRVVADSGGELIVAFVATSNRDAIRALVDGTEKARSVLPAARIVWIQNERTGTVFGPQFDPSSLDIDPIKFAQMRSSVTEFVIARLDDRIWQPVEHAGLNMVQFVQAKPKDLAHLWSDRAGEPLDPLAAALIQRRVSAWIAASMEGVASALKFSV